MKIQSTGTWRENLKQKLTQYKDDTRLLFTLKVADKVNVPADFTVRSRISDNIFTAEANAKSIIQAADDPNIVSLEVNKKLQMID